jgi:hypothetical protein
MLDQQYVFDRLPLNDVQKQALLEELIKARSDAAVVDNSSEPLVEPPEV